MTISKKTKEALAAGEFVPARKLAQSTPGEALQDFRELKELSKTTLAKLAEISVSDLTAMENGKQEIDLKTARRLARVLGVHPALIVFVDWDFDDVVERKAI